MKILFQGDSITDAGRDRTDYHNLGNGYVKYAVEYIKENNPDTEFEFINLGISGNQTRDLVCRLDKDFLDVQPDIISILIGINDVWHNITNGGLPNEVFEDRYRTVLKALKEKTNAKIVVLEPFLIPCEDKNFWRSDVDAKINIARKLAREFADMYIPLDGLFASAFIGDYPLTFAADGVHPTEKGAKFVGKIYADYVQKLIK